MFENCRERILTHETKIFTSAFLKNQLRHFGALVEKYLLLQEWRIVDKSNVENNKFNFKIFCCFYFILNFNLRLFTNLSVAMHV